MRPVIAPLAFTAKGSSLMRAATLVLVALAACATPRDVGIQTNERLAEAASRRGDWSLAADLWHRVYLADQLNNPRACLETSRALAELGDPASAEALLRDGIKRFPLDPALHELHGYVLEQTGWRRAAEAAYAAALELQPGLALSLKGLGRVRLQLGLENAAIPPLRRLVELDPTPESLRLLVEAARKAEDPVVAYEAYLHLFDEIRGETAELIDAGSLALSQALRDTRRASSAVCEAWLARALEIDPQLTRAHALLGRYRMLAGDDQAAILHLTRACETDPANVAALLDLAELRLKGAELEAARRLLDRADGLAGETAARARLNALFVRAEELEGEGG